MTILLYSFISFNKAIKIDPARNEYFTDKAILMEKLD